MGSDAHVTSSAVSLRLFQSTLPVWGATKRADCDTEVSGISIHAPRVGSDSTIPTISLRTVRFQSTLPVWGATLRFSRSSLAFRRISIHAPRVGSDVGGIKNGEVAFDISIHAPRVGSDKTSCGVCQCRRYFNPRSPCGERLGEWRKRRFGMQFQSTLPVWGATLSMTAIPLPDGFQSTLPVWGATR